MRKIFPFCEDFESGLNPFGWRRKRRQRRQTTKKRRLTSNVAVVVVAVVIIDVYVGNLWF